VRPDRRPNGADGAAGQAVAVAAEAANGDLTGTGEEGIKILGDKG